MVNVYQLRFTILQQEILRLLFIRAGTQLNQRRIAVILGVSQPAVVKALPFLEKEGLINISQDKESKRWAIELNWSNQKVTSMKRIDNLKLLYESGLIDYLEKEVSGSQIVLVGDYSSGKDLMNSTIEIAVIGTKGKNVSLNQFEKILERKIRLNNYSDLKELQKNSQTSLSSIISLGGKTE